MTRTLLIAASLLTLTVLGAPPAAACTAQLDGAGLTPGAPGGGVLGLTEWYVLSAPYAACSAEAGLEAAVGSETSEAYTTVDGVIDGAGDLGAVGPAASAATAYPGIMTAAASSAWYDFCFGSIGANTACLNDGPTSQTQVCTAGLAVPQPVQGTFGTLFLNANAALQATCFLGGTALAAPPSPNEVRDYAEGSAAALQGQAASTALDVAGAGSGAGFGFLAATSDNTCVWLTEDVGCLQDLVPV